MYKISNFYNFYYIVKVNNDNTFTVEIDTSKNNLMFRANNDYMLFTYITLYIEDSFIDYIK